MDIHAEIVAASLVAVLLPVFSGCTHDWDALEPSGPAADAGSDASGGTGGTGGSAGEAGTGGSGGGSAGEAGTGGSGGGSAGEAGTGGSGGGSAGDAGTGGSGGGLTDCDEPGAQRWSQNGHCYFPLEGSDNWSGQQDECASLNAYLVTITTKDEQDFVTPLVEDQDRWIGYHLTGAEFEWVTGEPTDFENWGPGEPNESGEVCARIRPNGAWADRSCTTKYRAICERE